MIGRHNYFRSILYTILIFVWCFISSAFAENDSVASPTINHHNPIIFRCDHNYPPFEYTDNQGHPKGFVVDVFKEVMKKLRMPYKMEFSEWKEIPDLMLQGKIDLTDMVYTNERAKKFKFGPIWCYSNLALVVRKNNIHLHIFSQLKDKVVAVENKSLSHTMLHDAGYDKNVVADDKLENAITELAEGNYDAVMCDKPTGMFFIKEKGIDNLEVMDLDLAPHEYCLVGNDEKLLNKIDYALSELKKDGTYDKLYNKWFVYNSFHISRIVYFTLGILLLITAILFVFIKLLYKQVNKSKRLLEEKNKRIAIAIRAGDVSVWGYNIKKKHFYNIEGDIFPPEGKSFEEVKLTIHPDDRPKFEELFHHVIFEKDNIPSYTFRIDRNLTNEYKYYDKEFTFTYTKEGDIDVVIGTSKDITNDVNKQHKLEEEREKALQADKIKSAFLANMSHEIRTPLNAIVGFSNLLQYTDDPEEREEYVKLINDNNDLLLHLINDILELSKIESGIIEIQEEEFDLAQFFNNTAASFKERNNNPEVQILCDNPYKHCLVRTDKNRLAQVLNNFTSNAVKHTQKGYIKIGYSCVDSGIRIYVEDTGNGIPKDKQHLIFERFEKLNNFAQGTGLGLFINKAIIEAMGGKIGFSSEEGKGSVFWAWNKCDVNITEHDNVENSNCTIHKNSNDNWFMKRGDKVSILVAEDNESNFLLVKAILRDYEITQAANGQEAVDLVSSQPFDLILMDIQMPIMDGLEATRKIREFNQTIPIVALTAYAFNTDRKRSEEVGCNDFITKPLKKSELLDIIKKYI